MARRNCSKTRSATLEATRSAISAGWETTPAGAQFVDRTSDMTVILCQKKAMSIPIVDN
jgi:hypothetical protein